MKGSQSKLKLMLISQGANASHFSYIRFVKGLIRDASSSGDDDYQRCELDSHADTCVAGSNALEIEHIDG
jgi:hypothetical protein